MLDPLYKAIGWLLALFYALIPNLGVAIILLTVVVMLVLFPLTAKQAKSMLGMQQLQPEMKKLQAKHKGDRQKLNEEMMKLYQEHKVNPLGGCLPLLAQMPVFISLFSVLRSVYKNVPTDSKLFGDLCGPHATVKACGDAEAFPRHLEFLGMDLSISPLDVSGGIFTVLPYFLLVGLVVITGFVQSKQTQRTTPPGANPQMLMIGKVLPVVFGVISLNFPAGLVLYFFTSNAWRLGQQEWIFRNIHLPHRERLAAGKDREPTKGDAAPRSAGRREDGGEGEAEATPEPEPKAPAALSRRPGSSPGGGLRALFRLPPAPNGDAEAPPAPAPAPDPPGAGTGAGRAGSTKAGAGPTGGRQGGARQGGSGQSRRRRNSKKKRKR